MRLFLAALMAVFFVSAAHSQNACQTPERVLMQWDRATGGGLRVATWDGEQAKAIVKTYNAIEPVGELVADAVFIATSANTPGQGGILFAANGCVVGADSGPMGAFEALVTKSLGAKS